MDFINLIRRYEFVIDLNLNLKRNAYGPGEQWIIYIPYVLFFFFFFF